MTKKIVFILVLMLFIFQAVAVDAAINAKTQKKIDKLMKKGDKSFAKSDFPKALETYSKILEKSTEYAPAYLAIAKVNNKLQKSEEAVVNLKKALEIKADYADASKELCNTLMTLAQSMVKQRQYPKANEYYAEVLAIPGIETLDKKNMIDAAFQIAVNHLIAKNTAKANEFFKKVIAIPGAKEADMQKYVNALYQMGINLFTAQKLADALQQFELLAADESLNPKYLKIYTIAHFMAGKCAVGLKDAEKSTTFFKKYIDLTQNNLQDQYAPEAYFWVGFNNATALNTKIEALKKDAKKKGLKDAIAKLALETKNVEPFLTKAIALNPNLELAYFHLGFYHYYCKNYEKAAQLYKELIAKFPNSPDINNYTQSLANFEKELKQKK
ncbi:MAG: tetratricopeptide repeat protein [bacterium]|nr:tetratricopeptide repeat protein [bacterium]